MKDIASGDSILFAPRLPADYAIWLGEIKQLSHFKVIILSDCTLKSSRVKVRIIGSIQLLHPSFAGKILG